MKNLTFLLGLMVGIECMMVGMTFILWVFSSVDILIPMLGTLLFVVGIWITHRVMKKGI